MISDFKKELEWHAMGAESFDLAEIISDLLRRIAAGRKTVRGAKSIYENFQAAASKRDELRPLVKQMHPLPQEEPAHSQAKAELNRRMSELRTVTDESNDLWRQFHEAITFVGPFAQDVSLLAERLPLTPEWKEYRPAIRRLNVRQQDCWCDPPGDPALETLEMRLKEMLELANKIQRKQVRRVVPFPTPDGATWKDVTVTFISDHRVQLSVMGVTEPRSYAEMDFEDKRRGGGKPNLAWECLRLLAKWDGKIEKPSDFETPGWGKIEKQVQTIRARFKELFGIQADPLPFRRSRAYEAQFKITLSKSSEY